MKCNNVTLVSILVGLVLVCGFMILKLPQDSVTVTKVFPQIINLGG